MRIGSKTRTPHIDPPAEDPPPPLALDDPANATQARAEAEQLRTGIAEAQAEAAAALQAAQAEATRLVAAARTHSQAVTNQALTIDRRAAELEARAGCITHAHSLREQEADARQRADDLTTERDTLTGQVAEHTARLAELAERREDTTAATAEAREAGNVDEVATLRARLGALDEVTGVVAGRRDTAQQRINAIGGQGHGGELDQALTAARQHAAQREELLDIIDPSRVPAGPDLRTIIAALTDYEPATDNRTTTTVLLPFQGA